MKTKLLHSIQSAEKSASLFFRSLFVFILITFSPLILSAAQVNSGSIPQDGEPFIYVSPDSFVYGLSAIPVVNNESVIHISAGTIVSGQEAIFEAKILSSNTIDAIQSDFVAVSPKLNNNNNLFEVDTIVSDKALKKLQDKVKEKIEKTLFSSTAKQQSILLTQRWANSGIVSGGASSNKGFACHAAIFQKTAGVVNIQIGKSKFNAFWQNVHYLQQNPIKKIFLRGPPSPFLS